RRRDVRARRYVAEPDRISGSSARGGGLRGLRTCASRGRARMTDAHEPPSLSHIGLRTADLDRAARFYTLALPGAVLRRRDEPDRRVWVRVLGVTLEIAEVAGWKPLDEAQRRALPQIGLLVGPRELDQIVNRLDAAGVPHHGPTLKMAGQAVGVYFSD